MSELAELKSLRRYTPKSDRSYRGLLHVVKTELQELLPGHSDFDTVEFREDYDGLEWDQQLAVACGSHQIREDLVTRMNRYRH